MASSAPHRIPGPSQALKSPLVMAPFPGGKGSGSTEINSGPPSGTGQFYQDNRFPGQSSSGSYSATIPSATTSMAGGPPFISSGPPQMSSNQGIPSSGPPSGGRDTGYPYQQANNQPQQNAPVSPQSKASPTASTASHDDGPGVVNKVKILHSCISFLS